MPVSSKATSQLLRMECIHLMSHLDHEDTSRPGEEPQFDLNAHIETLLASIASSESDEPLHIELITAIRRSGKSVSSPALAHLMLAYDQLCEEAKTNPALSDIAIEHLLRREYTERSKAASGVEPDASQSSDLEFPLGWFGADVVDLERRSPHEHKPITPSSKHYNPVPLKRKAAKRISRKSLRKQTRKTQR